MGVRVCLRRARNLRRHDRLLGAGGPRSGFELAPTTSRAAIGGQGHASEGARAAHRPCIPRSWQRNWRATGLINPKNLPSIRVAERIGEDDSEGRNDLPGRQMLVYGLDRAIYLAEVAPAEVTARRAG